MSIFGNYLLTTQVMGITSMIQSRLYSIASATEDDKVNFE